MPKRDAVGNTIKDAYGSTIQVPALNCLVVYSCMELEDISTDLILNIHILATDSFADGAIITRNQFDSIGKFMINGTLVASDGGIFDFTTKNTDSYCWNFIASSLEGTTIIGNSHATHLYTSHFGNDTLIAGNGSSISLHNSGYGVNTLIGGTGGTTFSTGVNPTQGTVFQGNGENNVLNLHEYCDITGATISGIQTLRVSRNVTLKANQFNQFGSIEISYSGTIGAIYAANGGRYDLHSKNSNHRFDLYASSSEGTILIGNDSDYETLTASALGADTLIAGNGIGATLIAGQGVNILIGGSGGDTFQAYSGLAAGSVVQGTGENNVLIAYGDISQATISGIQTLQLGNVTLTADQLDSFATVTSGWGGTITAATGGVYSLADNGSDIYGLTMIAGTNDGTTLIGDNGLYQTLQASSFGNDTLTAGNGGATLRAGNGNNTLTGGTGNDTLIGKIGNDRFTGGGGNETMTGGEGKDIAYYSGKKSEYTLTNTNGAWTITDSVEGRDGIDTFTDIEYLQFSDQLYPLPTTGVLSVDLNGGTWVEQSNGTFTFSGDVSIGLEDGNPYIISVKDGTYVLDDHHLTISGTFASIIDGNYRPLFTGQTSLSLTGASGAINWSTTLYEAAGLKPSFTSLNLANNDLRLQYDTWGLPTVLANGPLSLDPDTLIVTTAGPRLGVSGRVEFPDVSFKLLNIVSMEATDWSVSYNALKDQFTILGGFELNPGWPALPAIHAELTGDGLIIKDGDVADVALKVSLDDFAIKGWGFKDVGFSLDTDDNKFTGEGSLTLPFAPNYSFAAQLGFTLSPFELDSADLNVNVPDPGIPVFSTGWFITSLGGGISNLASTAKAPVLISGKICLEGPRDLIEMEVKGEMDTNHLAGSVTGNIIDANLIKFNGQTAVNWTKHSFKLASDATILDGVITGDFNFQSDFDLNFSARGSAQVKILKQTLAGNYHLLFSNDGNLSNDYVAGWVSTQISLPGFGSKSVTKGIKYSFDGKASTFGAKEVPLYASWIVDDTLTDLMVTAEWENAATAPIQTRVIVYDDLNKTQVREIIDEAAYATHNIAVIDAWSSDYAKVVYIATPDPGVWDVEVVNAAGLGTITYSADTTRTEGSFSLDGVNIDANIVTLDYSAINVNGVATLYFFADNDNDGYDGTLIGSATKHDGSGQFIWDGSSFEGGHYWLYGIMEDGVSVPVSTYAAESVHIIQPNQAPLLYYPIADMAATAGVAYSFQITAGSFVDLDAEDSLSFSASLSNGDPLPAWLTFDPSTATFSGTPGNGDAGVLDIQVIAHDTSAATASDIFRLTVALPESPTSFLSIAAITANKAEGNSGNTAFTFTVTRSGSTAGTSSVTYAVSGGTVTDNDFAGGVLPGDTITFAAGESNRTITINVAGDTTVEAGETFTVTLSNPSGATIETATATGTIENDDTIAPALIKGTWGNDTLCGGPGHNTLYGYDGNDSLDGGADADTLLGGLGSDTYYVDDTGDVVTETRYWRRENGVDTVVASIDWTLGANCENLTLTGGAKQATGNGLHNILIGNDGNNILDGKGGADTMHGGFGNDIYVVDNLADQTLETSADPLEIDTVLTSVNRTLGANLENLTLTGTRAINGAGNSLDNILNGNDAANKLRGAGGNDTLTGGGGQDIFYFDTPLDEHTNVDTITDFTAGEDLLRLDRSIFNSLTAGALEANQFCASTTGQASDGNDFLIYNTSNGDLLYDADGNGAGAAIRFATLNNHPSIIAVSCLVVG